MRSLRWVARILALLILAFGLPFYLGYGNPLPFRKPEYTLHDNLWLTIFPLVFASLILGWVNEKIGGYLLILVLGIGFLVSMVIGTGFPLHMLAPFLTGVLFLIAGRTPPSRPVSK